MATPVYSRPTGRQYLGNTNKMEVHNLWNERGGCQVSKVIAARHAVIFSPDTLQQAHAERYDNCAHCIGGSTR